MIAQGYKATGLKKRIAQGYKAQGLKGTKNKGRLESKQERNEL